jgi:hypothetical protein
MMEGLARVHDGSTNSIGLGYWLMNIIRINQTGEQITPLYNKLYSFEVETQSENSEIPAGIFTVMKHVGKQLTWAIDRGGDRTKLIAPLPSIAIPVYHCNVYKKCVYWFQKGGRYAIYQHKRENRII